MRDNPKANEIYRHFKGKTYQVLSIALHSETMEKMVVYQQLYAPFGVYVRPLAMFMSEVDHEKYPEVTQIYRFEKIQEPAWEMQNQERKEQAAEVFKSAEEIKQTIEPQPQEEIFAPDQTVMRFLEAESYEEKLEILHEVHHRITDAMIDTMAVSLDVEVQEGDIEQRYSELKNCLLKLEHFECNRLR